MASNYGGSVGNHQEGGDHEVGASTDSRGKVLDKGVKLEALQIQTRPKGNYATI